MNLTPSEFQAVIEGIRNNEDSLNSHPIQEKSLKEKVEYAYVRKGFGREGEFEARVYCPQDISFRDRRLPAYV